MKIQNRTLEYKQKQRQNIVQHPIEMVCLFSKCNIRNFDERRHKNLLNVKTNEKDEKEEYTILFLVEYTKSK